MNGLDCTDYLSVFPEKIQLMLRCIPDFSGVSEIRLRRGGALCATGSAGTCYLREAGYSYACDENAYIVTQQDIAEIIEKSCRYSVYAHQSELQNGFVTYGNGHRIGISGSCFAGEGGISRISSLCVRVAREYPNAADVLLGELYGSSLASVVIAGAPGTGKTTMLRSAAKVLASGERGRAYKTSVIDERYELAGRDGDAYCLCRYADIIGGCAKNEGILRAVRLLAPELIVCDETGSPQEAESMSQAMSVGVKFLASIHASSFKELMKSRRFEPFLEAEIFDYAVILDSSGKPGRIAGIFDLRGKYDEIYRGGADMRGTLRMGLVRGVGS